MHHPDPSSIGATPAASRKDKFLIAGVAAVAATAVAVIPVAQNAPVIQQAKTFAYDLTASMDATASPLDVYGTVLNTTVGNLESLGAALAANPAPVLSQILENQQGYAAEFGAAFEAIPTTLKTWYEGPNGQARLAEAQKALDAGDLDQAFRYFNHSMLYAFQGAFGPLIAPGLILSGTPRGGTEYLAGMPEQMAQNFTNIIAKVFTSTVLTSTLFQGAVAVAGGSVFELTRVVEAVSTSVASGNVEGAVNALVNTPGILVNAVLNGFDYGDVDDPNIPGNDAVSEWPALLTWAEPGEQGGARIVPGILQQLLVNIPKTIADAIDNTPEVVVPATTSGATVQKLSVELNVAPQAAVTEQVVEVKKEETPAVEVKKEETPAVEVKKEETATTTPVAGETVNADDTAKGKTKIADRIKAKISEAKEARQAKVKEAKEAKAAKKVKSSEAKKSNESGGSNADSGSASE